MDAIIFIGIQGTGKSTFYQERFSNTHLRINLDMLRTRHREKSLLATCLAIQQSFVVDNTNPAKEDRARYIVPARKAGFRIIGYYFQSKLQDALLRNAARLEEYRIPEKGVRGTHARLEHPAMDEGFDALYYVQIDGSQKFVVEEWCNEV